MRIRTRVVLCAASLLAFQTLGMDAYSSFGKWATSTVTFYFNPQNADVSANAAEAGLLVGLNAWKNEGLSKFSFFYGGRVNDTAIRNDGRNVVLFRNSSSPDGTNIIAATYTWTIAGSIVDADIIFWDGSFAFTTGTTCSGFGVFIEDIAAHEFGHALGLNHSTVADATMFSGYPFCSMDSRTLAADDIAGVQALYGVSSGANTAPTLTISSPSGGLSVLAGTPITFTGTASDAEDGNLSASIRWTSSIDGLIGTGASITRTLSTGVHVITASVTDSDGVTGTTVVGVTVVAAQPPPTGATNVALASAGATASASSTYAAFTPNWLIDGQRAGANWGAGTGGGWHDNTFAAFPDWVQIDFAGSYAISQVNVVSVQDNYAAPSEPTTTQTFSAYGVRSFEVQYWTGSAWATIPGATVSNNTLVWRTVTFSPVTTQKIRVVITGNVDGYSRLTEIEALTGDGATPPPPPPPSPPPTGTANVALASAGATASASSTYAAFTPNWLIDGQRAGANWGVSTGGGWHDNTFAAFPDWVQIDFGGIYAISQVNVVSVQDNYAAPSEPTTTQTFSAYGVRSFEVQYWTGSAWATIPGATVSNNTLVWRTVTFSPVTTQKIRVVITGNVDGYSRLTEIEALTGDGSAPPPPPPSPPPTGTANVALASAGATASASSTYAAFTPNWLIDGQRAGANWGASTGGGWHDNTFAAFPDWVQIDFAGSYAISQVNVVSVQDNYAAPSEPTATQTFNAYGVRSFEVQYWTGSAWATIPGATVSNNTLVWRTVTFSAVTTQKIRVVITGNVDGYSRLTEIEAFTGDEVAPSGPPLNYTYQVVTQYPHDTAAFTQGLELTSGTFYESTGINGASSLRRVNLLTGAVLQKVDVPAQYFAEGMTAFQGKIFQLTWQSGIGFIYHPTTFANIGQFSYSGEGWGLTHDSQNLILSDGTSQIRFLDPNTFQTVRTITVMNGQTPVTLLNELEYINGEIYANVWLSDTIVRINPTTGQVVGVINLAGLLPVGTLADVLNGIAYDAASGHLLVTGKYWPWVFEITLQQVN